MCAVATLCRHGKRCVGRAAAVQLATPALVSVPSVTNRLDMLQSMQLLDQLSAYAVVCRALALFSVHLALLCK